MNDQDVRLDSLLAYLCGEYAEPIAVPDTYAQKRILLRALVNVRPPRPVSREFLCTQDAFLREEAKLRGVVRLADIPKGSTDDRLSVWRGDITRLKVDAIVNAANSALLGCFAPCHHCIDNAIHTSAGVQLRQACHELMRAQGHEEQVGLSKITPGFNLPCCYVLHTVGPIVHEGELTQTQCDALASCYRSCLTLASERGLRSIAFCCISTGEYRFPKREAADIAVRTVREFLLTDGGIQRVVFDVFSDEDADSYRNFVG